MTVPVYPTPAEAKHEEGRIRSRDGTNLYWQRYTPATPRATVAVVHGAGDHSGRYPALTRALVQSGFEVALVDLHGHGRSEGIRWHVNAFSDYLDDMDAFVAAARAAKTERPFFIAAHSMGGLIAVTWAIDPRREASRSVAGFVLSSPWFKLTTEPPRIKVLIGKIIGKIAPTLPTPAGLKYDQLTSDPEMQRWTESDPLYLKKMTPHWFEEVTAVQTAVLGRLDQFHHPLLVLAGSSDAIADHAVGEQLVKRAASTDKTFRLYDGFNHEIWNEKERERSVSDAVAWIAAHVR
jgi:alpha-beta hydrolase superfamily lysophospholipase